MTRTTAPQDALTNTLNAVTAWCDKSEVPLIFGTLGELITQTVEVSPTTNEPLSNYISLLDRLRVRMIVADVLRVEGTSLAQLLQKLRTLPDSLDRNQRVERVERLTPHVGDIAQLTIYAFLSDLPAIVLHQLHSDWHEQLDILETESEELEEDAPVTQSVDPSIAKRNQEFGKQLATHPRFPFAKNFVKRRYLAESLFKDAGLSEDDLLEIVHHAEIIYDVEIRP